MTQLALLFIGALATGLAFVGLFVDLDAGTDDPDPWTPVVLLFASALLWGLFGMGAFSVRVPDGTNGSEIVTIMPLVLIGLGLAMCVGLYAFYELFRALRRQAADVDPRTLGQ
jgi:amino acid transporter